VQRFIVLKVDESSFMKSGRSLIGIAAAHCDLRAWKLQSVGAIWSAFPYPEKLTSQNLSFVNVCSCPVTDFVQIQDCISLKRRLTPPKTRGNAVRVIAKGTLREFWESSPAYADSETPLVEGYRHMEKTEVKAELRTASILKGGRVVFNIGGN
jgi:hypothetical protein